MLITFKPHEAKHLRTLRSLVDVKQSALTDCQTMLSSYLSTLMEAYGLEGKSVQLRSDSSGFTEVPSPAKSTGPVVKAVAKAAPSE